MQAVWFLAPTRLSGRLTVAFTGKEKINLSPCILPKDLGLLGLRIYRDCCSFATIGTNQERRRGFRFWAKLPTDFHF
jgi:hypothetical protein